MDANYCKSFKDLFLSGKYAECCRILQEFQERYDVGLAKNKLYHRFYFENNLIVSNLLSIDWDLIDQQCISERWEEAFLQLSDLQGSVRCVQYACNISLDLTLCITYNSLWWALMKEEQFHEHSNCSHHVLVLTVRTLQRVLNVNGETQLSRSLANPAEEVLHLAICITRHILHHPPRECLLLIDVLLLALLLVLEGENAHSMHGECLKLVDILLSQAPQTRIHLAEYKPVVAEENCMRDFPLLRFGMNSAGDVLDKDENCTAKFVTSFETLILIGSLCCLRLQHFSLSLKYLQDKDIAYPQFTFLIHYVKALVQLELNDGERCMYLLSRCPYSSMDTLMQARHNILKSQAYMHRGDNAAALQVLHSVVGNETKIKLPITAFLIAKCYGALGQTSRQIEVLDTLVECLDANVPVTPLLPKPSNGFEHRLLLLFHPPTELSLVEVLYASASACLHTQPKRAGEQLLELLRIIQNDPDCSKRSSGVQVMAMPELTDLLHSTAVALLKAGCGKDAKLVCSAALEQYHFRPSKPHDGATLQSLREDVIALMLLAESQQQCLHLSEAQSTLNKAIQILNQQCKEPANRGEKKDPNQLFSDLLARLYLFKALIHVERNFTDDATASFQRALTYNPDDKETLLHFAHHLLDCDQQEECLAIWPLLQDKEACSEQADSSMSIALQHLLGERTSSLQKDLIFNQLKRAASK